MLMVLSALLSYSQEYGTEKSRPSYDTTIARKCWAIDIEGEYHYDVVVTLKSNSFISDKYKVKVLVTDVKGNKIYKKTFKNANLYIFSDGQIHVGKPKFTRLFVGKDNYGSVCLIYEREGVMWLEGE